MIIHELFTNAIKYGALSNPAGTIHLEVERGEGYSKAVWVEQGGPPIEAQPERSGFGSVLLTQILPAETGATVTRTFSPTGLRCEILIPDVRSSP